MKGELNGSLYVALEGVYKIFFQGALTFAQNCEQKDTFDVKVDGLLDSGIEGVLEGAPEDAINNLYIDPQEASVMCESKQNFINIITLQLCCSSSTCQNCKSLTGVLWVEGRGVKTAAEHEHDEQNKARHNQHYF